MITKDLVSIKGKRRVSEEGRKRMSEAAKKRWAARTHCKKGHSLSLPSAKDKGGRCRSCMIAYRSAWNKKAWASGYTRNLHYINQYGITLDDYNRMLEEQKGLCGACHNPESEIDFRTKEPRSLHVDHCHKTGQVRQLLCGRCNRFLGQIEDDPAILRILLNYLERHL